MNVTNKPEKQEKHRDRSQYRCPENLKRLIELVNSIPPDRKLPHIREVLEESGEDEQRAVALIKEKLNGVPEDFFKNAYIYLDDSYSYFRLLRKAVHDLAQMGGLPRALRSVYMRCAVRDDPNWPEEITSRIGDPPWREVSPYDDKHPWDAWQWPKLSTTVTLDATGMIVAIGDDYIKALIGVQVDRLRECGICHRIFWAKQNNMVACNPRCSAANRQRLGRERGDDYNQSKRRKRGIRKLKKDRR